jgi:hypothetical protein
MMVLSASALVKSLSSVYAVNLSSGAIERVNRKEGVFSQK